MNHHDNSCGNHWIMEWLGLEVTFQGLLLQTLWTEQGHLQPGQPDLEPSLKNNEGNHFPLPGLWNSLLPGMAARWDILNIKQHFCGQGVCPVIHGKLG